jgi:branched-subunit amino acid ABC-type transport system permease component
MEAQFTPPAPLEISRLGRWLAGAQQLKDTLTIIGMNLLLVFALFFYGLPIPGLILYFLRWRIANGRSSYQRAVVLWGLSAVHELLCMLLFQSTEMQAEMHEWSEWLSFGYTLGLLLSVAGFAEAVYSGHKAEISAQQ